MSKSRRKVHAARVRIGRGHLGGRYVSFRDHEDLRPTLGRVRDAIFSMIADETDTFGFIDLCAGSGVMGFEAFSMGFRPVWMLETQRQAIFDLHENSKELGAEVRLVSDSALHLTRHSPPQGAYVCFADPPYADTHFHGRMLSLLAEAPFLLPGSIYLAEHEQAEFSPVLGWHLSKQKRYGRVVISVLMKQEGESGAPPLE